MFQGGCFEMRFTFASYICLPSVGGPPQISSEVWTEKKKGEPSQELEGTPPTWLLERGLWSFPGMVQTERTQTSGLLCLEACGLRLTPNSQNSGLHGAKAAPLLQTVGLVNLQNPESLSYRDSLSSISCWFLFSGKLYFKKTSKTSLEKPTSKKLCPSHTDSNTLHFTSFEGVSEYSL